MALVISAVEGTTACSAKGKGNAKSQQCQMLPLDGKYVCGIYGLKKQDWNAGLRVMHCKHRLECQVLPHLQQSLRLQLLSKLQPCWTMLGSMCLTSLVCQVPSGRACCICRYTMSQYLAFPVRVYSCSRPLFRHEGNEINCMLLSAL